MASIRKRGDLQWQSVVRKKGARSMAKTFTSKEDAIRWAREVERSIERGESAIVDPRSRQVLVSDVVDDYINNVLPTKRSDFMGRCLKRVRARFDQLYLTSIVPHDLVRWMRELEADGLGPQTIKHHIGALSQVYKHAARAFGVSIIEPPTRVVLKPTLPPGRDRRLRNGEFEALMDAAAPLVQKLLVLATETGMRRGELWALDWSKIDLKRRTITLKDGTTKNGKGRTVPLSSRAVAALQEGEDPQVKRLMGRVFEQWGSPDALSQAWGKTLNRAQKKARNQGITDPEYLVDLRFHDLRHEAVSRLFEKGLSVMEVASISGHTDLKMLQRYTHFQAEQLAQKLG